MACYVDKGYNESREWTGVRRMECDMIDAKAL